MALVVAPAVAPAVVLAVVLVMLLIAAVAVAVAVAVVVVAATPLPLLLLWPKFHRARSKKSWRMHIRQSLASGKTTTTKPSASASIRP